VLVFARLPERVMRFEFAVAILPVILAIVPLRAFCARVSVK
jgi:hypothetical protein